MTQPLPEGAMMSQADHDSVDYPNTDKVQFYIFTTPEHPYSNHKKDCVTTDLDIDVKTLDDLAKLYNYDSDARKVTVIEKRCKKEKLLNILGGEQGFVPETSILKPEGVFVFVFLTFQVKGDSEKFYAHKEEVTLNDVWDKIKRNPRFTGRPKLILVQADDISLLKTPETTKGGGGSVIETKKLPLECDRLTMISNIPQPGKFRRAVGPSGEGDATKATPKPSLLIQAFADVMQENLKLLKQEDNSKLDFLSEMSVYMNSKIQQGINELKGDKYVIDETHYKKMIRHPVVSTLRKDLYFKENMDKKQEEKE